MKQGITKREKIMLFVVGLIAVVYLSIQFVIIPLSARYNDSISERARLQDEIDAHRIEAATIPGLRERNTEAHARFYELTSGYPTIVENEEIDFMLTTLSNRHNLSPVSLRITPRPPPPPVPEPEDGEEVYTPALPTFTKATVNMNVVGSYDALMRLLDEVSSIQYIRLTDVSYSKNIQMLELSRVSATYEITFLTE